MRPFSAACAMMRSMRFSDTSLVISAKRITARSALSIEIGKTMKWLKIRSWYPHQFKIFFKTHMSANRSILVSTNNRKSQWVYHRLSALITSNYKTS